MGPGYCLNGGKRGKSSLRPGLLPGQPVDRDPGDWDRPERAEDGDSSRKLQQWGREGL